MVSNVSHKLADAELEQLSLAFQTPGPDGPKPGLKMELASFFLGGNIQRDAKHSISISSNAYVERLTGKYLTKHPSEYPAVNAPATRELADAYIEALAREIDPSPELATEYASKCGAAIYSVPSTRADVAYAVGMCARALTFPTPRMHKCLDRILVYLGQHADQSICYNDSNSTTELHAFSDSDWSVVHSTSGWCIQYGGAAVGYGSKRQQAIAVSSTEAEIMAASQAALEIMYFRGIISELGVNMAAPTVLYVDNQSAIALSQDRRSSHRSRHILRRYLKVRELVAEGHIIVKHVSTTENPADMFTKPLDPSTHWHHVAKVMGKATH